MAPTSLEWVHSQPDLISMKNVHTYTFGCKVNYFDTTQLEANLAQDSDVIVDHAKTKSPDMIVVNTCTVTENADKQANQLLRKLHRNHPDAQIAVTGCYAQSHSDQIQNIEGVDHVVGFDQQSELNGLLGLKELSAQELPVVRTHRTRANVKIQDGCKAYCSYCILPFVRGKSASTSMPRILQQVGSFVEDGHHEVVLTGTHIAGYGRDLRPRKRLSDVLKEIFRAHPSLWMRVSSLEPVGLTPDMIKAVGAIPTVRPHFHIPLQSGSDDVLKSMNRKYKTAHYRDRIEKLYATKEHMNIGSDVIVGYPGESQKHFDETYAFIESVPLSYLHVFPFSSRPGTKAAKLEETVSTAEKKKRVRDLIDLGASKQKAYMEPLQGQTRTLIVETKRTKDGLLKGVTPESVHVVFEGNDRLKGNEIEVVLTELMQTEKKSYVYQAKVL